MDYAELHLEHAVKKLCIGEKDVTKRLLEVWNSDLHLLADKNNFHFRDYPKEIKKDWKWIYGQLTKYKPSDNSIENRLGIVGFTLGKIKNSTGSKIVKRVYELNEEVKRFNEAHRIDKK